MTEPQWKLKVRQLSRWADLWAFMGWRWQWETRERHEADGGYYAPELFGWRGRTRTHESACDHAEWARSRILKEREVKHNEWDSWFRD